MIVLSNNDLQTQQTGSGGIDNLVGHLQENQAQYAYIKYEVPVEETTRTKFVLISWVGESTSPLKKGKVSVDKYDAFSFVFLHFSLFSFLRLLTTYFQARIKGHCQGFEC